MLKNLDTDGSLSSWIKNNNFDEDQNPEEQLADYFSLSKNDIEKFDVKKKAKKN